MCRYQCHVIYPKTEADVIYRHMGRMRTSCVWRTRRLDTTSASVLDTTSASVLATWRALLVHRPPAAGLCVVGNDICRFICLYASPLWRLLTFMHH